MNFVNAAKNLARADIVFWLLPLIMLNLIAGTLAQRYLGLFEAHKTFFAAFVTWAGPLPLPGGRSLAALLTFFLGIKFLFDSEWKWPKAGINLAHLGALILLIGGLIASITAREGFMTIAEGETSPYVFDYNNRALYIFEGDKLALAVPFSKLSGDIKSPFPIKIKSACANCAIERREENPVFKGMAKFMELKPKKTEKEPEENIAGLTFEISNLDKKQNGTYIAFEGMPKPIEIKHKNKNYKIMFGREQRLLPFAIKLTDFKKETYPGLDKARSYSSDAEIIENAATWPVRIEMNAPLRYKGYAFYQSSFAQTPEKEMTVLSVVENKGRLFPYIGTAIISLGLLLHLYLMTKKPVITRNEETKRSRKKAGLLLIAGAMIAMTPLNAFAASLDYNSFRALPVLHEGRLKPLETFARLKLKEYSGDEKTGAMNAAEWLAEIFFDPSTAAEKQIFLIRDAELKNRLDLPKDRKYFSALELQPGLAKTLDYAADLLKLENLTPEQENFLRLHSEVADFNELLRSFSLILPLNVETPVQYGDPQKPAAYIDLIKSEPAAVKAALALVNRKGHNLDKYSAKEKKLAAFAFSLERIRETGENNAALKVMPVFKTGEWVSPWKLTLDGLGSPETAEYLTLWRGMAEAYRNNDAIAWRANADKAALRIAKIKSGAFSPAIFNLEILYDFIKPFTLALWLYGLTVIFALIAMRRPRFKNIHVFLGSGVAFHAFAILCRIVILGRPPVGTLYESVLFVSFICAAAAFITFMRKKELMAALPGTIAAFALLFIAPVTLQKGESMEMLVAVLNTNFWLATHVLCITAGYAASILTACLAHIYLFTRKPKTLKPVYTAALAALFLTALGTTLGGIWADQSWGRFWGWDPKENGALLIVLWLIWILHGKVGGALNNLNFAALAAGLSVIVAISWFGVNLLSVGLHSYGFTEGMALGLGLFCAAQIFVILALRLTEGKYYAR